jgi:hypothetical protein
MSGIIGSKINIRGSGRIAKLGTDGQVLTSGGAGVAVNYEDLAAGISWQSVVTGSTLTAVAGNGYWIDTTSNTCTITLPASASNGDTIIFADFDRTWGTNKIIIDSNGLNYQSDPDTYTVEYSTDGQAVKIVYSDATTGWIPILDKVVADAPVVPVLNDNGIFFAGLSPSVSAITNIVSNTGVVATDVAGVGTVRNLPADCEYGGDKGIFAFGGTPSATAISTLISNTGVASADVSGVGTARTVAAACDYGGDKGIVGYGYTSSDVAMTNLISNTGVVGTDVSGVGSARYNPAACEYSADKDKGIFAYGYAHAGGGGYINTSNLVSNTGVMGTDVTGVGTARDDVGACSFGNEKGIFGYGSVSGNQNMTNIVSSTGVVGTDVSGVGTARHALAATQYGEDKAIFGYGSSPGVTAITNLVSNTGVVATDVAGVGTARYNAGACSYN